MKNNTGKTGAGLWIVFSLTVFAVLFFVFIVIVFSAYFIHRLGAARPGYSETFEISPLLLLLFMSVTLGAIITLLVARKILNPIKKFSNAAREIAKGNFDIRLQENGRITEINELTQNFNLMARELSSVETLRNDFIVNVSHEFKTPIAAIEGYASLLRDKNITESERDEYTQMIIDGSRQLSTLTGNILRISKLENQEFILEKTPFRFDEMIRQAVLMLENEWSRKEIDLQIDLDKITYTGSENLLMQVAINLIGNAVKFTPRGGSVYIRLYAENAKIVFMVADNGYGMDESVKARIFDKFYQGDTARKSDGNGLGLALVKRIVDLCGGNITVESVKGKGSTFQISLQMSEIAIRAIS